MFFLIIIYSIPLTKNFLIALKLKKVKGFLSVFWEFHFSNKNIYV